MSEARFNSLSEKDKIRVLRNRLTAKNTRVRRQARIEFLTGENASLESSVNLKETQIAVLLSQLGGGDVKAKTDPDCSWWVREEYLALLPPMDWSE